MLTGLVRLARPQDWIKNVFVALPAPFALAAKADFDTIVFLLGLSGFCLINSAVYTLNDLCDAKADRLYPTKCRRPIASGIVSRRAALVQMAILLLSGFGLCLATGKPLATTYAVVLAALNVS